MSMCSMEQGTKTSPAVEVWRPVVGWEGLYEVSSHGRVRSLDRMVEQPIANGVIITRPYYGRVLSQKIDRRGYCVVNLSRNGKFTGCRVHRLVAEAFIPNPDNLPLINHKDECKTNNHIENIEWCTTLYNNCYGTRLVKIGNKRCRPIEQLTIDGEHVAYHKGVKFCGYPLTPINQAINKGSISHGYRWRYVDN